MPKLVRCQIVVGALALGVLSFGGFVLLFGSSGRVSAGSQVATVLMLFGAVLLVGGLVAGHVVRRIWVGRLQRRGPSQPLAETNELLSAFGTITIVRSALAEAPSFLFLIVYMLHGLTSALAGAALALVTLLAAFPTQRSFEAFAGEVLDPLDLTPR